MGVVGHCGSVLVVVVSLLFQGSYQAAHRVVERGERVSNGSFSWRERSQGALGVPELRNFRDEVETLRRHRALNPFSVQCVVEKFLGMLVRQGKILDQDQLLIAQLQLRDIVVPQPFLPAPSGVSVAGPVFLANAWPSMAPVGLSADELVRGIVVIGVVGSGKTTIVLRIALQLPRYWIFDLTGSFLRLLLYHRDALTFDRESLRFSVLKSPPGFPARDWFSYMAEIFSSDQALMTGAKAFLLDEELALYESKAQILKEGNSNAPVVITLQDLLARLRNAPCFRRGPTSDYRERIKGRLTLTVRELGEVFATLDDFIPQLVDRRVIFHLPSLTRESQSYLINSLIGYKIHYRKAQRQGGGVFRSATIIDEAHSFYTRAQEESSVTGYPAQTDLILKAREYGEGIVTVCQMPSRFSHTILSQAQTVISFRTEEDDDLRKVRSRMQLNDEQAREVANFQRGICAIKMSRWSTPIKAVVPPLNIPKEHPALPFLARRNREAFFKLIRWVDKPYQPKNEAMPDEVVKPNYRSDLSKEARDLLTLAGLKTFSLLKELLAELKFQGSRSDRAVRDLASRPDLCKLHEIKTGLQGRSPKWLEVIPQGYAFLKMEVPKEVSTGKSGGGSVHRFWQHRVYRKVLETNEAVTAVVEHNRNGKLVDVFYQTKEGKSVGVEVQLEQRVEAVTKNVVDDIDRGLVDRVILLVDDCGFQKRVRRLFEEKLSEDHKCRVVCDLLGNYL